MARQARDLEVVTRSGRKTVCVEEVKAAHCMQDAKAAYMKARGSNAPTD